ncbi:MAG: DUF3883 domain-containing protein [Patescibacteria group bacterium]
MKNNFDKISWQQILTLCHVINSSLSLDTETISRWYNSESTNFKNTLEFFKNIGVIEIRKNKVRPRLALKQVIEKDDKSIKHFFIDVLFNDESNLSRYFGNFFDNFELSNDSYKFEPTTQERLKYSGIRNFLIGLGVLRFESMTSSYVVKKELVKYLTYKSKSFAYDVFERKIKSEKDLGLAAELLVYSLEKNKFKNNKYIQKGIVHVSLENVKAGYDIRSYEMQKDKKIIPKYIEVKAVSEDDWNFYWSRNEIAKSKQLGDSYYLYLIPSKNDGFLDINSLLQIKNPYTKVFLNKKDWIQEIENISFSLKKG